MFPGVYGISEWQSPPPSRSSLITGTIHGMSAAEWMTGATKWWSSPKVKSSPRITLKSERRIQGHIAGLKDALWTRPHVAPKGSMTRQMMAGRLHDVRKTGGPPGYVRGYKAGLRLAHNKQNEIWSRRKPALPPRSRPTQTGRGIRYNPNQPRNWRGEWM
jgi:hypothetical protein